ncbi:rhodanese-like domain-containing protein [Clostridium sp.]|uniref:rhodanese-like domain-containing protein n=1 Tax=Clostridium sp. TaxID=1506 RepID=UPI003F2FAD69
MNTKAINVNDLDNLLGDINLIDIREDFEVSYGTLKGAKNIPMGNLLENPNEYINIEEEYYIMCQSGMRSARTVSILRGIGYKVINVNGGMGSYVGSKIQ